MILIAMACSQTKRPDPGMMPAFDRYDGPMWKTLRAALDGRAVQPHVWFLSARYGFQQARLPIPDYDHKLTYIRDMLAEKDSGFNRVVDASTAVLFAGGKLYRDAMWRASRPGARQVTETDGKGIGLQRAQLRAWIEEHCR